MRFKRSLILSALFASSLLWGNSSNPPNGYHGESNNCASCHSGNLNTGDGSMSITGLPSTYVPGQTYNLALTVSGTNSRGYGFQLIPKANGTLSGNLSTTSGDMAIESGAAEHRGTSSSGIWNFQWTAPSADEGTVTFYATGLATGGTSGNSGDYTYTLTQNISANSFTHASMDWNMSTDGVIFSSPVVGTDGSIYVGSNDNKLHALNPDGTGKWTFTTGNWVDSSPAIGPDGTVYVGSWDNKIYALNPDDGSKIWEFETNSYVVASPSLGADGKIYVGSKDSIFYALESNGSLAWEYFAGQPITSSAALGQDGTIYFGDENGTFHAINPDGSNKWTYEVDLVSDTNNSILSSPALDLAGNIYFGSGNGYCYSLSDNETNASLNWKIQTGDRVDVSPVLGINDDVFFVSRDGYMRSISTLSGGTNWIEDAFVGDVFYSSPVVDENGRIYVIGYTGGGNNHLFAFDANGSKAWDTNDTNCPFQINGIVDSSLVLSEDGKLYFGAYDNLIYCIDIGSPPASSDWPMFKRTQQRDGAWPSYLLDIFISPIGAGIVSGGGIYNQGALATLSISSTTSGYTFSNWSGASTSSETPLSLTVISDLNLTANFEINSYTLTVATGAGGSVSGSGQFQHGTLAAIMASPNNGYDFSHWTGEGVTDPNAPSTSVTMDQAKTITANFSPKSYSISVQSFPDGIGTISGSGNYDYGQTATLTASTSSSGYNFINWSGDASGNDNPLSIVVDSNLSITANFDAESYTLVLLANTGGSVTGEGNFSHGSLAQISATPDPGYSFAGWTGTGIADSNASTTTVTMTADLNITATFSQDQYTLNVLAGLGGTVSGAGIFTYDEEALISATPDIGYFFESWTGDIEHNISSANTSLIINENKSVTALFSPYEYSLSLTGGEGGTVTGGGQYSYGQEVAINAIPDNGYIFDSWTGDIEVNSSSPSQSITVDGNISLTATFSLVNENHSVLTILTNPMDSGTTLGGGSYPSGTTVDINAFPIPGYQFLSWEGTGIFNENSSSTQVSLTESLTITANFEKKSFSLLINNSVGGTSMGSGTYQYGSDVNVTAIPSTGYTFTGWTGNGITNPSSNSTLVRITEDMHITPNFAIENRMLTINLSENGSVSGGGEYPYGTLVEITATPNEGYSFNQWNGSTTTNQLSATTTIQLVEDANLSALFSRDIYNLSVQTSTGGSVTGGGNFYYGYNASLSAIASSGYQFQNWEGEGIANPLFPFTTVRMTADLNVTAIFIAKPLAGNLSETEQIAEDWYNSSWFGIFFQRQGGWAYHMDFGWIYPIIDSSVNIWFWHDNVGWIWASPTTFSNQYLWSESTQNWLFWDGSNPTVNQYFNYATDEWLPWIR